MEGNARLSNKRPLSSLTLLFHRVKSIDYAIGMDHVFCFTGVFDTFHESCFSFWYDLNQEIVSRGFTCGDIFVFNPVVNHMPGNVEYSLDMMYVKFIL